MMEYRVRTKRSDEWVEKYKGAQVADVMVNLVINGECRILKPDGKPLAVFLPGAAKDLSETMFPEFSRIRMRTDNRGYASGSTRVKRNPNDTRSRTIPVMSSVIGYMDPSKAKPVCRLTAFNAREVERWDKLQPTFKRIGELLRDNVPERYQAQMDVVNRTNPDWIIKDTPFTTITVNNTYPTGIHTDKGDLDEGYSTLAVFRRGFYTGGWLTFPQYGVAADMQDGDVLLMDAHEWHGNTPMICQCREKLRDPGHYCSPGLKEHPGKYVSPERVSIVSYYRTQMEKCETQEVEEKKWIKERDKRNFKAAGVESAN